MVVAIGFGLLAGTSVAQEQSKSSMPPKVKQIMDSTDCLSCHRVDMKVVGPAFAEVAKRYANSPGALQKLVKKVKDGGAGNWGNLPMPAHPQLSDAQIETLVKWILSLSKAPVEVKKPVAAQAKRYTYKLPDGKVVSLSFPVFTTDSKVTKTIFLGWEKFNSYCFRCHGADASGSEYAPDLRQSLNGGMKKEEFIATMMEGRPDKGMPKWAGFFDPDDAEQIYEYVKARSVGILSAGRPND